MGHNPTLFHYAESFPFPFYFPPEKKSCWKVKMDKAHMQCVLTN